MKPTIVAYDGIAVIVNSGTRLRPDEKAGGTNLYRRGDRLERGRRIGGQDSVYTRNHIVRDLLGLQGTGDEET